MSNTSTQTTSVSADGARRAALAAFLKAKRATLAPQHVGIATGRRRRARGLLREEVAQRARISPTWYIWLEQARDIRPSEQIVGQLADALLLNDAERAHLLALARADGEGAPLSTHSNDALRQFIDGLTHQPAYVVNGIWDVLAWNHAALELCGDFARVPAAERNILHMIFCWQPWRELIVDHAAIAASATAQFRGDTARFAGHPAFIARVARLNDESPEFACLWHAARVDTPHVYVKRLRHPKQGLQSLTYAALAPRGATHDLSVIVYSPLAPESETDGS